MISGQENFLRLIYENYRYIGVLANVTFNNAVRENNSKENTSSIALEYFKQVDTSAWIPLPN